MDNERAEYGADIEHLTSQRVAPMPPIRLSGGDVEMSIPEWTRTTNLRLRRPALYPIELRGPETQNTFNRRHRQACTRISCMFLRQQSEPTELIRRPFRRHPLDQGLPACWRQPRRSK